MLKQIKKYFVLWQNSAALQVFEAATKADAMKAESFCSSSGHRHHQPTDHRRNRPGSFTAGNRNRNSGTVAGPAEQPARRPAGP